LEIALPSLSSNHGSWLDAQRELVQSLRDQLEKEEKTLEGMEKAKEFFPN
jgi:hypothetical protein